MRVAPLAGSLVLPTIPVSFTDEQVRFSPAEIQNRLYGPGTPIEYSVTAYWREVSGSALEVTGTVLPSVTLPKSSSAYIGDRLGYGGIADSLQALILDILREADKIVDWTAFVDPQDPDHRIPAVVILTAGQGGQCLGDRHHVWPHRWSLTDLVGAPFKTHSTTATGDTIVVDDYIIQGVEECFNGELTSVGVVVHETGHLLGLPDLYNTLPGFSGTGPVQHWDLMAMGNYNAPSTPAHIGAWSRAALGWADVTTIEVRNGGFQENWSLDPVAESFSVLLIPFVASDEFILLENRHRLGSDQALHGEGLLAWYVNPEIVAKGLIDNTVNNYPDRPGVAVIQADGRNDLEKRVNLGDASDVYPGTDNVTEISVNTNSMLRSKFDGTPAGFRVSQIQLDNRTVRFRIERDAGEPLAIQPDTLPAFYRGSPVSIVFTLEEYPEGDTILWSANPSELATIGLVLHEDGRLEGVPQTSRVDHSLTIRAAALPSGRYGERTYALRVLQPPSVTVQQLVDAILDPERPLDPEATQYYDGRGNQNGQLDIGDLLLAIRRGEIKLSEAQYSHLNDFLLRKNP